MEICISGKGWVEVGFHMDCDTVLSCASGRHREANDAKVLRQSVVAAVEPSGSRWKGPLGWVPSRRAAIVKHRRRVGRTELPGLNQDVAAYRYRLFERKRSKGTANSGGGAIAPDSIGIRG